MNQGSPRESDNALGPGAYEAWRGSELGSLTERLEDKLLLDLIGDPTGRDVLDLGCGDGALTTTLAARGGRAVGIDPNPVMIGAAVRRKRDATAAPSFCVGHGEHLPFPPEQFDLVVAKTILCFVADASGVFAEIARVLRPGGRLVIGELGKYSLWALQRAVRGRLGSPLWRQGHFWTPRQLRALARGAGLTVECVRGAVYYPRSRHLARLMHRMDDRFADITTVGAAFLAVAAFKPD